MAPAQIVWIVVETVVALAALTTLASYGLIARDLLEDIMALTRRINELEKRLTKLVKASHPSLLEIPRWARSAPR